MAQRIIGLDIGSSSIKAALVRQVADGYEVERLASVPVPFGAIYDGHIDPAQYDTLVETLRELLAREKFGTNQAVIGYSSSAAVFMDEVLVPPVEERDQSSAIPLLISSRLSAASESEFDFTVVEPIETDDGPRLRVLVYRVLREHADLMARLAEDAGFDVVGGDLTALAALRVSAQRERPPGQADAFVDIGASAMTMVVHCNGIPVSLSIDPDQGGSAATAKIADAMGLDHDGDDRARAEHNKIHDAHPVGLVAQARSDYNKALAARVAATARSAISRSGGRATSLASMVFVGGGSRSSGLQTFLTAEIPGVPLGSAVLDPSVRAAGGGPLDHFDPTTGGDFTVAIGLGTGKAAASA